MSIAEPAPPRPARELFTGRCLCGAIRFEIDGPLRSIVYCHCGICRRWTGHLVAATACAPTQLRLLSQETLRWYAASPKARRGFCHTCGSSLFWAPSSGEYLAVLAGALDAPTGLTANAHVFVADAGDYYQILDDLPRHPGSRRAAS